MRIKRTNFKGDKSGKHRGEGGHAEGSAKTQR